MSNQTDSDKQQLSYWMGKVDTLLVEMRDKLDTFINDDKRNWVRFHEWQDDVNKRLQDGNSKFENHEARISELEKRESEKSGEVDFEKYVSWPWIKDNILVPVIKWGIILFLTYLLVNAIQLPGG